MFGLRRAHNRAAAKTTPESPPVPESYDVMVSFVLVLNLRDIWLARSIFQLRQNVLNAGELRLRWEAMPHIVDPLGQRFAGQRSRVQ